MKKWVVYILSLTALVISLCACGTAESRGDERAEAVGYPDDRDAGHERRDRKRR